MLNVAIIGCGGISWSHLKGYLAFPERCQIKALVDIYPDKAEKRKETYNLEAQVLSSHKDLLDRADIDLVSICTPPYTHSEIACDCLKAHKHVLLEKPMASSLAECDAILEALADSRGKLSIIAQNRFKDSIMGLKRTLDTGLIGPIKHIQVDSHWWRGHSYYDLWWRGTWEKEGGGCTLNHAVHHIDMLSWMVGLPDHVTAVLGNLSHDNAEVEDISMAILEYDQGTMGQITSSLVHHGEEQKVIIQGADAKIMAPFDVKANRSMDNGFPEGNEGLEETIRSYYEGLEPLAYVEHIGQIDNMLTAIETHGQPLITGEDGRRTLELIAAIFKAGSERRTVSLPLSKEDPFYSKAGILAHAKHFYEKTTAVANMDDTPITFSQI